MKKFILLIVTFAYLASTSGATVYIQQCMGKTIAWSLMEREQNKCTKCGMHANASNDCCKDHVKVLKVHNDPNLPESYFNKILLSNTALPGIFHADFRYHFSTEKIKSFESFTSSRSKINCCILFCSFLI